MNLLTDEEIISIVYDDDTSAGPITFARAIEAAVLEKVGKVDAEPLTTAKFTTTIRMGQAASMGAPLVPASALAALRAENERLKDMHNALAEAHSNVLREIDTVRAQLEQAQAEIALQEKLIANHHVLQNQLIEAQATIARQQSDAQEWARVNAMAQADAARYLWICQQDFVDRQWVDSFKDYKAERDTRIDAARAALEAGK